VTVTNERGALADEIKIKCVSKVSDPPVLSAVDVVRIQQEARRLHDAFTARTASMELLTVDDLKVRVI